MPEPSYLPFATAPGLYPLVHLGLEVAGEQARPVLLVPLPSEAAPRARYAVERFVGLNHPHLQSVIGVVELEGGPSLALPYTSGESLRAAVARSGRLPAAIAARIVADAAAGLHELHTNPGLAPAAHGWLDASAVHVADTGVATLWGFAPALCSEDEAPARTPEQLIGGTAAATRLTDVHLLGLLLYEALTGIAPFRDEADYDAAVLASTPSLDFDCIPESLRPVIARATARKAADRYPSAAALREAVERSMGELVPDEIIAVYLEQLFFEDHARRERIARIEAALAGFAGAHAAEPEPPEIDTGLVENADEPAAAAPQREAAPALDPAEPTAATVPALDASEPVGPFVLLEPAASGEPSTAGLTIREVLDRGDPAPLPEARTPPPAAAALPKSTGSRAAETPAHRFEWEAPAAAEAHAPAASKPRSDSRAAGLLLALGALLVLGAIAVGFQMGRGRSEEHAGPDPKASAAVPASPLAPAAAPGVAPARAPAPPAPAAPAAAVPVPTTGLPPATAPGAARADPSPPQARPKRRLGDTLTPARDTAAPAPRRNAFATGPGNRFDIEVSPPVDVTIDGQPAGRAPVAVVLGPGAHQMTFSDRDLGIRTERTIQASRQGGHLAYHLGKGSIAVAGPAGSTVYVDGRFVGQIPFAHDVEVWEGSHGILVDMDGTRWKQEFSIGDGERMRFQVGVESRNLGEPPRGTAAAE